MLLRPRYGHVTWFYFVSTREAAIVECCCQETFATVAQVGSKFACMQQDTRRSRQIRDMAIETKRMPVLRHIRLAWHWQIDNVYHRHVEIHTRASHQGHVITDMTHILRHLVCLSDVVSNLVDYCLSQKLHIFFVRRNNPVDQSNACFYMCAIGSLVRSKGIYHFTS